MSIQYYNINLGMFIIYISNSISIYYMNMFPGVDFLGGGGRRGVHTPQNSLAPSSEKVKMDICRNNFPVAVHISTER